ncbi:ATP-binding protein [Nocardioides abyssi]|uniref:Biotin carboxylase N-terminal domain-containing protein n=1 Tax=Nocardioides abyssi TaxID=3058370 RepID=A0ABT8ET17_9ACTN|nr:biotin carboxylase N-terminal domain-containing protein [Nocardioides abyssi]MDN4161270.1 biotin carboxylase N-terminal domain-containing protein [Nocardioides abyssi]
MPSIHTLLVANRGEIALRVFRTAARLGIRTVAIHTDLDATAPHVRAADDAVRVGSYLDVDEVVAAAVAVGADAVHPGYGFLSERSAFAAALEAAGVTLVGPSAQVMEQMGRKDLARDIAVAAGVPVVPAYALDDDPSTFAYPVLVKAAAGGGGKGMRVVRSAGELPEARAAAAREAASAFGDETLLIEKYVERGRHLEVQVMGDSHGNVVHLFERDCSTQRRHQKVLEEAPGPTVDADLRHRMTAAAVALARQVGYVGAGTVEFLLDADTGDFYFLEMNTRLQVEHPVTEAITGLDLVEEQLRVAAGEPLSRTQEELAITGHAIEARVYAEDAFGGFLPQAGRADLVRWPSGSGIRVDHALESGQVVSTSYDPMLGKVIAHGPDRESARQALLRALEGTAVTGLTTNTGFLRALVASDEFRDATIDTAWLDRHEVAAPGPDEARLFAAWTAAYLLTPGVGSDPHPFQADGWRLAGPPAPVVVELDRPVVVEHARLGVPGTVDEMPVTAVAAADLRPGHEVVLELEGRRRRAVVDVQAHTVEVVLDGQRHVFTKPDVAADTGPAAGDGTVVAPMPGTVLDVRVAEGQQVTAGELLGAMEAMKMEFALTAPYDSVVTAVEAVAGRQVALGARLFEVTGTDQA